MVFGWLLTSLRVTSWLIILRTEEQEKERIKTREPSREQEHTLDNDMHIMMV
jgi:hypothetical protein